MANTTDTVLVIGSSGQLGSELTMELRNMYGGSNVVAADIAAPKHADLRDSGPFEKIDVLDPKAMGELAAKYKFKQIYQQQCYQPPAKRIRSLPGN
jgi:nucleoside-diphosphate-sugar epimerase